MIWFLILIPIGLVVFGILYDIKNKSFKEIKAPPKGKSSDAAFRDANTHNNVNSSGSLQKSGFFKKRKDYLDFGKICSQVDFPDPKYRILQI